MDSSLTNLDSPEAQAILGKLLLESVRFSKSFSGTLQGVLLAVTVSRS